MAFNFGAGVNGLARGLVNGIAVGRELRGVVDENRMRKAQKEGLQAAKDAREADIASRTLGFDVAANPQAAARDAEALRASMQPQQPVEQQPTMMSGLQPNSGYQQPQAGMMPPTPAETAGLPKMETTRKSRQQASKEVGSIEEYYQKVAAPKIYESFLEIDPQKAEAFRAWNEDNQVRRGQKLWARALRDGAMGNFDGFAKNLVKAYNTAGYYEDGTVAEGAEIIKGQNGTAQGIRIKIRNADGKRDSIVVNGMEEAVNMGINFLSPGETFEKGWSHLKEMRGYQQKGAQQAQQQQQQINMALLNDRLAANRGMALEEFRQQGRAAAPGREARSPFRQSTSVPDVRLRLHERAMTNDMNYRRMTPAQQSQYLDERMSVIMQELGQQGGGQGGAPGGVIVR